MEAYIYDTVRTVRGRGNKKGSLNIVTPTHLATQCLTSIRDKNNLDPTLVEDVILGCVTQVMDQGANIAKTAAQQSGYGDHLCGVTLNRFCGSGLESINQAAAYVKSGFSDLLLAGGVESMSRVKMGSDGGALMMDPAVALPGHAIPQGVSADLIASKYGYSRNDVDSFAVESQKRAAAAETAGHFKSRIPVTDINGITMLGKDENPRPGTTVETLAGLQPSFEMMAQMAGFSDVALDRYPEVETLRHVHHAGNSSAKAGMNPGDIDLYEINEAFAAVAIRAMEDIGISHDKVNVNGGAIALGHPLGATGAMLMGTVIDELERTGKSTGLVTLCIGGGMGIATVIELV